MHDMPRKKLYGVCREKSRHGRKMWFYREGKGKRTRLPDNYGSPEFMEAYKRAVAGDTKPMESFTTRSLRIAPRSSAGSYCRTRLRKLAKTRLNPSQKAAYNA